MKSGERGPTGFIAFTVVWFGQVVSILGTVMSGFALAIWAWQITGEATALALISFFSLAPTILASPLAGVLVDRWDRKIVMMLSDSAGVLATAAVLALFQMGNLEIWHLYATGAFTGFFYAFQRPAYSAAITTMMPEKHYGRASGMLSVARFAPNILAPILAALLLDIIGIGGILVLDIATFFVAIGTLISVHIPQPVTTEEGVESLGGLRKELVYGFSYISERLGLLVLALLIFAANMTITTVTTVLQPMILARTDSDAASLGVALSAIGFGGLLGGTVMSIWGGPRKRVKGVFWGLGLAMVGVLVIGLGRNAYMWAVGGFMALFFIPIVQGSNDALWQSTVQPDVQGKVFATRNLIGQVSAPLAMALAGPLADGFFEPALMSRGGLGAVFGDLMGVGAGSGMSLMVVLAGIAGIVVAIAGYALPTVRSLDKTVSDHSREHREDESVGEVDG